MTDLTTALAALDDATAERILTAVSQQRLRSGAATLVPLTADLAQALGAASQVTPSAAPVPAGDLARHSLLLLAEDPALQPVLRAFLANPPAERFADPVTLLAVGAAALVVLQSSVKVERDAKGKWTFQFHKDPLSNSLLKALIEKLGGFLPGP
jgi:hypothetical protein